MSFSEAFKKMGDLATGAHLRRQKDNDEFLRFHREIVENVPSEVIATFGNLEHIALYENGQPTTAGIELTIEDHLWWKEKLAKGNVYFRWGVEPVKACMLQHLAKQVETNGLEPAERKALLALLDEAEEEK